MIKEPVMPTKETLPRDEVNWRRGSVDDMGKYFPGVEGEMMREIYETALRLFPEVLQLQPDKIRVIFTTEAGTFAGGASANPNVANLALGNSKELASKNLINRISLRLGGTDGDLETAGWLVRLFALAHEIGHIVQGTPEDGSDQQFVALFGDDIDRSGQAELKDEWNYTDDEYSHYVQSGPEANADFIALYILENWDPEAFEGPKKAGYGLSDWKKWAEEHKIVCSDGSLKLQNL
ncbi:MAG: hypothetical protein LBL08_01705 [Candidatus Nomurabacteria bacterium]|jgi:hypothetical protein|nr:hypothetical protein [Candidatus Nomurabacteria bacterium]